MLFRMVGITVAGGQLVRRPVLENQMSVVELPTSRSQPPLSEEGWTSLQPALAGRIVALPELLLSRLLGEPL